MTWYYLDDHFDSLDMRRQALAHHLTRLFVDPTDYLARYTISGKL